MAKQQEKKVSQGFGDLSSLVSKSKGLEEGEKGVAKSETPKPKVSGESDEGKVKDEKVQVNEGTAGKKPTNQVKPAKEEKPKKKKKVKTDDDDDSVSGDNLFNLGIDFKAKVSSQFDFDDFKKIFGTEWKEDPMSSDNTMQRLDDKHHRMLKIIADNTGSDKTKVVNNILNAFRYANLEHIKRMQKENSEYDF